MVSTCLREDEYQHKQTSRKSHDRQKLKSETYILERTRAFFTGRSDVPCSGIAHFEPCSGTARLGPVVSALLRFDPPPQRRQHSPPCALGLFLRPPQRPGLDHGPRW
jgi:hypothetical protein